MERILFIKSKHNISFKGGLKDLIDNLVEKARQKEADAAALLEKVPEQ